MRITNTRARLCCTSGQDTCTSGQRHLRRLVALSISVQSRAHGSVAEHAEWTIEQVSTKKNAQVPCRSHQESSSKGDVRLTAQSKDQVLKLCFACRCWAIAQLRGGICRLSLENTLAVRKPYNCSTESAAYSRSLYKPDMLLTTYVVCGPLFVLKEASKGRWRCCLDPAERVACNALDDRVHHETDSRRQRAQSELHKKFVRLEGAVQLALADHKLEM